MSCLIRHWSKPVLSCTNQLKLHQNQKLLFNFQSSSRAFSSISPISVKVSIPFKIEDTSGLTSVQIQPSAGIKHVAHPRKRCRHCYFQVKDEQLYVMCTANPRHYTAEKQKNKKWGNYVFTHATQGSTDGGSGRGSRHMNTQNSFRLDF